MYTDNSEYLCHYGIPGMRWGQRRALHKEVRNEYHRLLNENSKKEEQKIRDLETKMSSYGTKHKLNSYEDANAEQRKVIDRMETRLYNLEDKAYANSKAKAAKAIIKKYGEKEYNYIKAVDDNRVRGTVALVFGVPILALAGLSALINSR